MGEPGSIGLSSVNGTLMACVRMHACVSVCMYVCVCMCVCVCLNRLILRQQHADGLCDN